MFHRLADNDVCNGDDKKAVTASNDYLALKSGPVEDETLHGAHQPDLPDDIAIKVGQLKKDVFNILFFILVLLHWFTLVFTRTPAPCT